MSACKITCMPPFSKQSAKPDAMKILLVGCGKMGGALLKRWQDMDIAAQTCVVDITRDIKTAQDIPKDFYPDIIVFAVKPQTLPDIIADYAPYAGSLFLSIVAGKTISFLQKYLGEDARVIRAMPNTPALIGQGITGLYASSQVTQQDKKAAERLLLATGEILWLSDETLIDPLTALSGSGPAYVFLLAEVWQAAAQAQGLSASVFRWPYHA